MSPDLIPYYSVGLLCPEHNSSWNPVLLGKCLKRIQQVEPAEPATMFISHTNVFFLYLTDAQVCIDETLPKSSFTRTIYRFSFCAVFYWFTYASVHLDKIPHTTPGMINCTIISRLLFFGIFFYPSLEKHCSERILMQCSLWLHQRCIVYLWAHSHYNVVGGKWRN